MTIADAFNLATQHHRSGNLAEAEAIYRQILSQQPDHPGALHGLGIIASQAGQYDDALALIDRALLLQPANADFHSNLGLVLSHLGRLNDAIAEYRKSISLDPLAHEAHYNLANALRDLGRASDAIAAYEQSLSLRPDHWESLNNLGSVLRSAHRVDDSVAAYRRALKVRPDHYESYVNLGNALCDQGCVDEAIGFYEKAESLNPTNAAIASRRLLALQYQPRHDAQSLLHECRLWNQRYAKPLAAPAPHRGSPSPDRRLRIGYVSPDFRTNVVGWNILPLLAHHDHARFEIFCYSSAGDGDEMTQRIRRHADTWRDITQLSDQAAVDLIRADQIDVLIDLSLHSPANRLLIFARKPAPVQITYLGYLGTTGLDAMDYRLSDPHIDPPGGDETCYSERTIRLPNTYWCYQPGGPTPDIQPAPSQKNGYVTFGCLCAVPKMSDPALDAWANILSAVPTSRLLLYCPAGTAQQRISSRLSAGGVSADRIEFVAFQPWDQYIQTYQRIDIALDPFPCGGGITTCDSLWMGVPVVSLIGQTSAGRGSRSVLCNIGLPELAAENAGEYHRLAGDCDRLIQLRPTLRQRLDSPLTDAKRFANDIETIYRNVFNTTCLP